MVGERTQRSIQSMHVQPVQSIPARPVPCTRTARPVTRIAAVMAFFLALMIVSAGAPILVAAADAAEPAPEESILATLAANMIAAAGTGDYTMECGPKTEAITSPPRSIALAGDHYCVMNKGGTTIFGTFGPLGEDAEEASTTLLAALEDANYAPHLPPSAIDPGACADFDPAVESFQECSGAIRNMHAYVYGSLADDTMYVIVSTSSISGFESAGFITGIIDFFKGLFGINTESTSVIESTDRFHHGYFARLGERKVTAQWYDETGVIVFEGFVTNLSASRPPQAEYLTGHNKKQVLRLRSMDGFTFNPESAQAVSLWRKYTSGLRLKAVAGTPIAGDMCGDGNVGFDEQCEPTAAGIPNTPPLVCKQVDPVFAEGALKCHPASDAAKGCTYDTSACVSCADNDGDKYYGGAGSSGALAIIGKDIKLGMAQPYGPENTSFDDLLAARKRALNVKQEVFPITYDQAFRPGTRAEQLFDMAVDTTERNYNACVASHGGAAITDADRALCEEQGFTANAAVFDASLAAMLEQVLKPQPAARPCALAAGKLSCPDGYSPGAIGITTNYSFLLERLKAEDVAPTIRLTLGACADGTCGPYGYAGDASSTWKLTSKLATNHSNYNASKLLRVRSYCYVAASGIGGYWQSLPGPAGAVKPTRFIVIGDPYAANMSPESYNAVYSACKRGIESALGTNALVLHGLPAETAQLDVYTQFILQRTTAYDGVYIEPRIIGDRYKELDGDEYVARANSLSPINLSVTALFTASLGDPGTLYGSKHLLDMALTRQQTLYDHAGVRNLSDMRYNDLTGEDEDRATAATRYWTTTMNGLQGTVYRFGTFISKRQIPAGVTIIGADVSTTKSTITIFNTNGAEVAINGTTDLNLTACSLSKVTNVTPDGTANGTVFTGHVPGRSIVQLELGKGLSCLTPGTGTTAACSVLVDCNDNLEEGGAAVNPGVPEKCADGIDNNCNGVKDEQPCDAGTGTTTTPGAIVCNYNGTCDDGEDPARCRDCTAANEDCPTEFKKNMTKGQYDIFVRSTPKNTPQLSIVARDTVKCKMINHGSTWLFNTTSDSVVIFRNQTGEIAFTRLSDGWQFKSQGTITPTLQQCWGITSAHDTVKVHFSNAPFCFASENECQQINEFCGSRDDCCADPSERRYFECTIVPTVSTTRTVCRMRSTGGGGCFIAGTPVLTPGGEMPIERIAVGDTVVSFDTESGKTVHAIVSGVEEKFVDELVLITPEGIPTITTTPIHPFWTQRGWVDAGNLVVDDDVLTLHGWKTIAIEKQSTPPLAVYNLHVDDPVHNFFAGGVLVHNKAPEIQTG